MIVLGSLALACVLGAIIVGGLILKQLSRDALALASVHLQAQRELLSREVAVKEREVAIQEQRAKAVKPPAAIPPDLLRRISKWDDPVAQDLERKVILDAYAEHQDEPDPWAKVRQVLPAEPKEDWHPDEAIFAV